jgi:flagellar basal-body rod protein FlgB
MDLKNLTVFSLANKNMQYLSARQRVLAANIANASTPDYLAQDIEKPSVLQGVVEPKRQNLALHTTNRKHFSQFLSSTKSKSGSGFKVYTPQPKDALTIDGNGVILEDQMNEASKASSEYKRMITIYNSYKNMLSIANTKING